MQQSNIYSDSFKYLSSTTYSNNNKQRSTNGCGSTLQHASLPSQFGHNVNVQQIKEHKSISNPFPSLNRIPNNMVNASPHPIQQPQQSNYDSSLVNPIHFSSTTTSNNNQYSTNGYESTLQYSSLESQFGHNANVQQIIEQNSPKSISNFFSLNRIPPNMVNTNSSHLQQLQQNDFDSSYPLQFGHS